MKLDPHDVLISAWHTTRLLGVSPQTLLNWTRKGRLNPVMQGNGRREYRLSELQRLHDIDPGTVVLAGTQAARMLGVTPDTLREWSRTGKIVATRTGLGRREYALSEVERLLG